MNIFEELKKEHEKIERELLEIETMIEEEEINYPNLVHVLKNFNDLWANHEHKEERLFEVLRNLGIDSEIDKLLFDHREIKGHKKVIADSIKSGNEMEIKASLDTDARMMIDKIKKHFNTEVPILKEVATEKLSEDDLKVIREEFN